MFSEQNNNENDTPDDVKQFDNLQKKFNIIKDKEAKDSCRIRQDTHDPDIEEIVPSCLQIKDIGNIIMSYNTDNDYPNQPTSYINATLTLFGKPFLDLLHTETSLLGNMILRGTQDDETYVLNKVRENQDLMKVVVVATDPLGTPVEGTLLQIAAMAGDVSLAARHQGFVEKLIEVGGLSKERVEKELLCITSEEAKLENRERIQRYLTIMKKFAEDLKAVTISVKYINDHAGRSYFLGFCTIYTQRTTDDGRSFFICQSEYDYEIEAKTQLRDWPVITSLHEALQAERKKTITSGYIFDSKIMYEVAKWYSQDSYFQNNYSSCNARIFWVNGFGGLQRLLSSRDKQVIEAGMDELIENDKIPMRYDIQLSKNFSADLGIHVYLEYRWFDWQWNIVSPCIHTLQLGLYKNRDEPRSHYDHNKHNHSHFKKGFEKLTRLKEDSITMLTSHSLCSVMGAMLRK